MRREVKFVYGFQAELDRLYGWGLQWGRGGTRSSHSAEAGRRGSSLLGPDDRQGPASHPADPSACRPGVLRPGGVSGPAALGSVWWRMLAGFAEPEDQRMSAARWSPAR
ncbi:hypothetical protein GCM10020295_58580 [Streptomyces cinereospinus]